MGPLSNVRVIEIAGIGPGPFAAMLLSDMGADVVRVDRAQSVERGFDPGWMEVLNRGRRSIGVDLKQADGVETVLRMVEQADALIEGFRPGVAERLGIGPDTCCARNPKLVYGRMTGWGQDGPYAQAAGHDINYISLAGALEPLGMLLAFGVACALLEARSSGEGQVVDAAMVDGSATLMAMAWGLRALGAFDEEHLGGNVLDTGAPFYDTYETADGKFISVGSLEPQFYAELIEKLGLSDADLPAQMDRSGWDTIREKFTALFKTKTRDEWSTILEHTDTCFAPVLTMSEAADHPHIKARDTVVEHDGVLQPAPAPRFSRTPGAISRRAAQPGQHTDEALADWGFTADELAKLRDAGAIK